MSKKVKLEALSYELVRQDKANVILSIEVINAVRANVQKEIKKKAEQVFKLLKGYKDVSSSTQAQNINDNLVQKGNKWEKEGYKGSFFIELISYNFDELNEAIEKVETLAQVSSITTSLSSKTKADLEAKLTQQAITNFKQRAELITESFGFKKFQLNSTNVSRVQDESVMSRISVANTMSGSLGSSSNYYVQPREERVSLIVKGSIILKD